MYLILFVMNDPERLDYVLTAWERAGVSGVTVIPSTGLGRIRQNEGLREDVPLMPGLRDFYRYNTEISNTLFTLVESQELADKVVKATEAVVGNLDEPGNGVMAVLPTVAVHGLIKYGS